MTKQCNKPGRKNIESSRSPIRIKLTDESIEKLDAMNPNLHITNQIRDTIEYAYNTKHLGKVQAITMDQLGNGYEQIFITKEVKDNFEYYDFLCKKIEFYPYAGYFNIEISLEEAFANLAEIDIDVALKKLLTTKIEKSSWSKKDGSIKWRINGSPNSVFSDIFENPTMKDSYNKINQRSCMEYLKRFNKIDNVKDQIMDILCNSSKAYSEWHLEYFDSIIEEKLTGKNGLKYEEILGILMKEFFKGDDIISFYRDIIRFFDDVELEDDVALSHDQPYLTVAIKQAINKIQSSLNIDCNNEILKKKRIVLEGSLETLKDKIKSKLSYSVKNKEIKGIYGFLGEIQIQFEAEHNNLCTDLASELKEVNQQLVKLKEYSKKSIFLRIKPATFTITD